MTKKIKKSPAKKSANKKSPSKQKLVASKDSELVSLPLEEAEEEIDYIFVYDYQCGMSAYEDPDSNEWHYAVEIFTEDNKLIDIHSQHSYKTYQDALLDCYGILEYLGFGVRERKPVMVNRWNEDEEKYDEETVFFDGYDFFKDQISKE